MFRSPLVPGRYKEIGMRKPRKGKARSDRTLRSTGDARPVGARARKPGGRKLRSTGDARPVR
jgi:hypothetical protein